METLEKAKQSILEGIAAIFPASPFVVSDLGPAPSSVLGDLAIGMFKLAKSEGKAPAVLSEELREKWSGAKYVSEISVAGPYVNFKLDRALFVSETLAAIKKQKNKYGTHTKTKERVMVEYVSPNNNKPLHLGHLRNAAIGESISNLLEAHGDTVVRAILLNDRGVAIAKAMVAYQKFADGKTPESEAKKSDHFVGDLYVQFEKHKANDLTLEPLVHETLRKWEAGDKATVALWRKLSDWCTAGQKVTYKTLGIRFDKTYLESKLYKKGKKIVEEGIAKGVFSHDEKENVIAKIPSLPDKVVLRADGTAVYITTDLALTVEKMVGSRLTRSIWVVGNEQDLHLRQLFGVMRLLGYAWAPKLEHLSYGMVRLPEGRMKSREGTVVDADELVEKLAELASEEIKLRHDYLLPAEVAKRAHEIALGALKYYLLSVSIPSDMVFNPKESLAFTGKTGPYLQYTNARINSMLQKAAVEKAAKVKPAPLTENAEWQLVVLLSAFPEAVRVASEEREPSHMAKYLYDLAKAFSEFYEQLPVLKADPAIRASRLELCAAVGQVLTKGLGLLGMPAPKEM